MPRVTFVKSARKNNSVCKKGESYYWWKFRYGGKRESLTRPRPSQLTQSAYYGTVRSLEESIEDANIQDNDELISVRDDIQSELENLRDETQESLDNMPESLQYSPTGELLQERIDAVEEAINEVECIEEFDEEEPDIDDFDQDCPDCDGTGDNPDYDADDEDNEEGDEDCSTCSGTGEGVIDEEFHVAQNEWQESLNSHVEEKVNELSEAVANCEV